MTPTATPNRWSRFVRGKCAACGAILDGRGRPDWTSAGMRWTMSNDPAKREEERKARDAAVASGAVRFIYETAKHKCGDGLSSLNTTRPMVDVEQRPPAPKPKRGLARLTMPQLRKLLANVQAEIAKRGRR